jgi:hypothetical protein
MKKRLIYTIFIVLLFAGMYWLNKDMPITTHQWKPTFETNDRQPFGAYAFDKILNDSWKDHYLHTYYSLYDIADLSSEEEDALPKTETEFKLNEGTDGEINDEAFVPEETISIPKIAYADYNVLIIANYLRLDSLETKILLKYVEKGGSVILAANSIPDILSDTLNITITHRFNWNMLDLSIEQPMEKIRLCAPDSGQTVFTLPQPLAKNYFETLDTINYFFFDSLSILSETLDKKPTGLRYQMGEGNLILLCNPLLFTNYGILSDSIQPYILRCLAYLNPKPLIRTEYYQVGSQGGKSQSELRVILSERPLKWAYYTVLITILVFMIFTAKRKQKVIPILKPPDNKMRAFVHSIAGLYLQKNSNADIILKKQIYWGEKLKRNYGIDIVNERQDYDFYKRVAAKTRQPFDEIRRLFLDLGAIDETTSVSDEDMMQLVTKMNEI